MTTEATGQDHAQIKRDARIRAAHMNKSIARMSAFVRANPGAVIEMDAGAVIRPGQIGRYQFHIEVDADSFERFAAKNGMK